jgi:hypothetical protein
MRVKRRKRKNVYVSREKNLENHQPSNLGGNLPGKRGDDISSISSLLFKPNENATIDILNTSPIIIPAVKMNK